jgi:thiol-disulfide isomerase/thioredoxin
MKNYILITFFALAACYGKKPEITGKEGKILPNFEIQLADSTSWLNTNDIKPGKPFIFFLFGPHCPYSRNQMQDFIDNIEKFKPLQVFAITPYPFNQMEEFYKNYDLQNYINVTVGIDQSNFFGNYIKTNGVPFIAIYDKNKKLIKAFRGITDFEEIYKTITVN